MGVKTIIAESHPEPGSTVSAAIEDDGVAGYLHVYRTSKKKQRIRSVWLYNRIDVPPRRSATDFGRAPYRPAPASLVAGDGRLTRPEKCRWTFLWDRRNKSLAVACDARLRAFVDVRIRGGYSRLLRDSCHWGEPWRERAYREVVAAIRPVGSFDRRQDRLTTRAVKSGVCFLDLQRMTRRRIRYGRPKSAPALTDFQRYPIWIEEHNDRTDVPCARPVVNSDDVTAELVSAYPVLTVRVEGTNLLGTARYDHTERCLDNPALYIGGRWVDVSTSRGKSVQKFRFPLVLVPLASLLGESDVRFLLRTPRGRARRQNAGRQ